MLLVVVAVLAVTSLVTDSPTFDEPFHLAAGLSYLKTGDFRLSPDHPPLARMWVAWPLLRADVEWPPPDNQAWIKTDNATFSVQWLFELNNKGHRFVLVGRCMMVVLLLATCLATYGLARTLFGPSAGLLALTLAALSPTLLAHGRLITTDLPITLCNVLVLLTFARLMRRITWPRLIAAASGGRM
ncbi:MAG: glycosyltransferase family 39 protein, partial [Phycisphaerae bacterium]|nr:glycosyltransferase family 39 protein [Phycisphaerae bacterium]